MPRPPSTIAPAPVAVGALVECNANNSRLQYENRAMKKELLSLSLSLYVCVCENRKCIEKKTYISENIMKENGTE